MAIRFKARSTTPGDVRLASGVLAQLIGVADIRKDVGRGDGGTGTLYGCVDADGVLQAAYGILDIDSTFSATGILTSDNTRYATGVYTGGTGYHANGVLEADGDYAALSLYTLISTVVSADNVRTGIARYDGGTNGNMTLPVVGKVISDTSYGTSGTEYTGTYHAPDAAEVISTAVFGVSGGTAGTYDVSNVAAGNIKDGVWIGGVEGTYAGEGGYAYGDNDAAKVLTTAAGAGSYVEPVQAGYSALAAGYGAGGATSGTLAAAKIMDSTYGTLAASSVLVAAGGTFDEAARNTDPGEANVWTGTSYKIANVSKSGSKVASSITNCSAGNIKDGVVIGDVTGTYTGSGVGSTVYMIGLKAT